MHEELRVETRDSARRFFLYILGDAGKLFVPVLNFSAKNTNHKNFGGETPSLPMPVANQPLKLYLGEYEFPFRRKNPCRNFPRRKNPDTHAPVTIKSTHAHGKTSFLNDDDDDDITLTDDDDDDVITCENAPPPP